MKHSKFIEEPISVGVEIDLSSTSSLYYAFGKRLFDLTLALLILPLALPLIAAVWLITKRDGGAGMYTQPRVGRNGKRFNCYKIRSMVVDADEKLAAYLSANPEANLEWTVNQKLRHDPRITRFGHFIRKTSLDELPQVFNVIKGDMSFLGPRPFMECQEKMYRNAGGSAYFKLRPGISGPWQVFGRGETSFVERVSFDNAYLANLSFVSDVKLVLHTIRVLICRTGH